MEIAVWCCYSEEQVVAADLKALAEGKRFSGRTKWQG